MSGPPVHVVRDGHGPSLVLTHRMGGSVETWAPVAEALAVRFTVVRWDLPGHGRSAAPPGEQPVTREDVLAALDAVVDGLPGPVVLVGHSIGGYHTLAWAITRPGRAAGVVVLGGGIGFRGVPGRERYNRVIERSAPVFGVPLRVAQLGLVPDNMVIDGLPSIDAPVLALVGREDRGSYHRGAEYLVGKVPSGRKLEVPGGHDAQLEHPEAVAAAIADFAALVGTSR